MILLKKIYKIGKNNLSNYQILKLNKVIHKIHIDIICEYIKYTLTKENQKFDYKYWLRISGRSVTEMGAMKSFSKFSTESNRNCLE
jgi:hypothetical protein